MKMTGGFELIETESAIVIIGGYREEFFDKRTLPNVLESLECVLSDQFTEEDVFILNDNFSIRGRNGSNKERRDEVETRRREFAYAIDTYMQTGELPK